MNKTVQLIPKSISPEEHHFWLLVEERLAREEEMHIHRRGSIYSTVLKFRRFGMIKLKKCRIHDDCSKIVHALSWNFTPASSFKESVLMDASESNILKLEQAQ